MAISINGTSGVVYPAGGAANTAGAGVGTTDTQTLTNKTLTSPTITGPTITGTISGSPTITSPTISGAVISSMASSVITSGTAQASTSGTSIDFTSIPSWVKRITVMFSGVSTSGTSVLQAQIGAGSITTTGYTSGGQAGATVSNLTSGFILMPAMFAANTFSGTVTICNQTGYSWVYSSVLGTVNSAASSCICGGNITLSGTLDRVRITTVNGTDTFDAGSINILYE